MSDRPRILIVEDEPIVLKVAGLALESQGFEFAEACDVASAKELLGQEAFGVVVTDLKLPGASGFELLDLTADMNPRPEVIIITGYATIDNVLESFRLGSFDFVPKPFDVDELVSVVDRAACYFESPPKAERADHRQYFLGRHSWVRLEADGAATIGAAETITGVAGPIAEIRCADPPQHTRQGESFSRLISQNGFAHRVRAPVSGQIIATNPEVFEDLELIRREPLSSGWLVRVIPSRLDRELVKLSPREG